MSSNPNFDPSNPYSAAVGKTSLMRTCLGRVVLPPLAALDGNRGLYHFSDDDLNAIFAETRRQRRWWRFSHYLRLGLILLFLVWTFFLMPSAALHNWPFN